MGYYRDIEQYLKSYPELQKWMNECLICHTKGYTPDMPKIIGGEYSAAAHHIRRFFRPLEVNENGICLQCAKYYKFYQF